MPLTRTRQPHSEARLRFLWSTPSRNNSGRLAVRASLALALQTASLRAADVNQAYLREHYTKREYQIPMRDGIKLFAAVYSPKDDSQSYPLLLTRTPYSLKPYGEDVYPDPGG